MSIAQGSVTSVGPATTPLKAVAFVDGQNLFHDAQRAFGSRYPDYDPLKLAVAVCARRGWDLVGLRFYTGVPTIDQNPRYKFFWDKKIFAMRQASKLTEVVSRKLKDRDIHLELYRGLALSMPDVSGQQSACPLDDPWVGRSGRQMPAGTVISQVALTEKGIDVSIAVDSIRYAFEGRYDVCLYFSQDADLGPAATEIKAIGKSLNKSFVLASAFPSTGETGYGVPSTIPIRIDRELYNRCIDPKDYFPSHPLRR